MGQLSKKTTSIVRVNPLWNGPESKRTKTSWTGLGHFFTQFRFFRGSFLLGSSVGRGADAPENEGYLPIHTSSSLVIIGDELQEISVSNNQALSSLDGSAAGKPLCRAP